MAVLTTCDFEGIANNTTLTSGDLDAPWDISSSGFVALTSAAIHGTIGARADNVTSTAQVRWQRGSSSTATVCQSYYWRLIDNPGTAFFGTLSDSGTLQAAWRINTNGTVAIRDGFTVVDTSTATISLGEIYRSEWLCSTAGQELRIYEGESETPIITLTGALTNNSHDRLLFGVTAAGAGHDFEMDTLKVADDWTGPHAPEPDPEPASSIWHLVTGAGANIPLGNPIIVTGGTPQGGDLAYIGDSLTYQNGRGCLANGGTQENVKDSLDDLFTGEVRVDGLIGRPIVGMASGTSMEDVIDAWRGDNFDPDTWVLALGSNNLGASDGQWGNWCGQALSKVAEGGGQYTVYWVTTALRDDENDSRVTRFWNVLGNLTPPANVTLIPLDFNTAIHAHPQEGMWSETDESGRHMTFSGYDTRNAVIHDLIQAEL